VAFNENLLAARLHVAERIVGLRQHARRLERLLPMCCCCKEIRATESAWHELESNMKQQGEFDFSHTCCPCCYVGLSNHNLRALREAKV
jgi:hypothetical protein